MDAIFRMSWGKKTELQEVYKELHSSVTGTTVGWTIQPPTLQTFQWALYQLPSSFCYSVLIKNIHCVWLHWSAVLPYHFSEKQSHRWRCFFLMYFLQESFLFSLPVFVQVSAGGSGGPGQQSEETQLQVVCSSRTTYWCFPKTFKGLYS